MFIQSHIKTPKREPIKFPIDLNLSSLQRMNQTKSYNPFFRVVKTPADHQANIKFLRECSMGDVLEDSRTSLLLDLRKDKNIPTRNISPNKKRAKAPESPRNGFLKALNHSSSYIQTKKLQKQKADSSLSSILSLAKEDEANNPKPRFTRKQSQVVEQKQDNVVEQKQDTVNTIIKAVFNKKENPARRTLKSAKTLELTQSCFPRPPSSVAKTTKSLKISSPAGSPKMSSPSPVTIKFASFLSHNPINSSSVDSPRGLRQPATNEATPNNGNLSSSPKAFKPFGRKGSDIVDYLKKRPRRETSAKVVIKPFNMQNSMITTGRSSGNNTPKVKTGIYRLGGHQLSSEERSRLDNFIGTDFRDGMTYTNSYMQLDVKKENEVNTLEEAKQFLLERSQAKDKVHQTIQEYRKNNSPPPNANNGSQIGSATDRGIEGELSGTIGGIKEEEIIPVGMPRLKDFELFSQEASFLLKNVGYRTFLNPMLNLKSIDDIKTKTKVFQSQRDNSISLRTLTNIRFKEKKEESIFTLRNVANKDHPEFSEMLKIRFKRIRKCLKDLLRKLGRLDISLREAVEGQVISKTYYEREGAEEFIKAAKRGDTDKLKDMLEKNKFYVCEYDSTKQTSLHWAAKRGNSQIVELLLKNGAEVDAIDLTSKTPLFYALREGRSQIVRMLLVEKANPWSAESTSYRGICNDPRSLRYLNRARQLSVLMAFPSIKKDANEVWQKAMEYAFNPVYGES